MSVHQFLLEKPTLFSFSKQDIKDHYRKGYQAFNWLQQHFNRDYIFFDLENFYLELREQIVQLLLQKKILRSAIALEDLHHHLPTELKEYGNDGISKIATFFYETNNSFQQIVHRFIHHVLYKKIILQPFLFQAIPTFRIHCPNAVNSDFFPHFHTDLALGHPPYEMNLWIPLTEKRTGHGFYLASFEDSKNIANFIDYDLPSLMNETVFRSNDYLSFCKPKLKPVEVESGQVLLFDGRCFHTAMPLQNHTRMSIDFRIVLQSDFVKANLIYENKGIRRQIFLLPEDYYYPEDSAELGNTLN